jgi:hypothetical protein
MGSVLALRLVDDRRIMRCAGAMLIEKKVAHFECQVA